MKKEYFFDKAKRGFSWRAVGLVLLINLIALTSCSSPSVGAVAVEVPENFPGLFIDACRQSDDDDWNFAQRTVYLDLYNYHCTTLLVNTWQSRLEVNGYQVFPSNQPCPAGTMVLLVGDIDNGEGDKGVCLAFVDNGTHTDLCDSYDTPIGHFCVQSLP